MEILRNKITEIKNCPGCKWKLGLSARERQWWKPAGGVSGRDAGNSRREHAGCRDPGEGVTVVVGVQARAQGPCPDMIAGSSSKWVKAVKSETQEAV